MKLIDKLKTTTLDQDFLKDQFINAHPWRLPFAILNNASEETCKLADTFDMLDHNYRQYLCGNFKTLRKVFSHIRDVGNGWGLVLDYFDDMERIMKENELYEFLEIHKKVKKKVIKLISKYPNELLYKSI